MSRLFNAIRTKLLWKLLGCIIISALIAIGCAAIFGRAGYYYVENTFDSQEMNRSFQLRYMEDLQKYVVDNEITPSNIALLENWSADNVMVYFSVYYNNKVIFNSDYSYADTDKLQSLEDQKVIEDISELNADYFYSLNFSDGSVAGVDMFCYDFYNYGYYIVALSVLLGILVFVIVFTRLISRKLNYIKRLELELGILEGGDLEYPITVKGSDEIGSLANGIDQMRLSIMENNRKEQDALQANKNLVTAMSHDLRTPLTTLTGYLEILSTAGDLDEAKKRHYLELSVEKTREIKELSDELFEYFLVYGEEQRHIDVEKVPAYELVMDLIENQFLHLEEDGYTISGINKVLETSGSCLINPQYMRRVLNNILSNLTKYAEKESAIIVTGEVYENRLIIVVSNVIKKNMEPHESTKIGIITCERIMKLQGGSFETYEKDGRFFDKLVILMEND